MTNYVSLYDAHQCVFPWDAVSDVGKTLPFQTNKKGVSLVGFSHAFQKHKWDVLMLDHCKVSKNTFQHQKRSVTGKCQLYTSFSLQLLIVLDTCPM